MPNFLENIFGSTPAQRQSRRSARDPRRAICQRDRLGTAFSDPARAEDLRRYGLQPGDRSALLAPNSIRWIAIDLALMAEGVIVVPLYSRQAPAELAAVMKDCQPRLLIAGDAALGDATAQAGRPTILPYRNTYYSTKSSPRLRPSLPSQRRRIRAVTPISSPSSTPPAPPANRKAFA